MASKSKRRGRVFRASCILAALIIAGSSFAWFTSKDEVTNRLTANSDYGVSIVESFTPPKNWIPGQEINKDVYAVNTGSIAAFVKESISGNLTYTYEKRTGVAPDESGKPEDYVELDKNIVRAIDGATSQEAGGFLAWTNAKTPVVAKSYKVDGATYTVGSTEYDGYDGTNTVKFVNLSPAGIGNVYKIKKSDLKTNGAALYNNVGTVPQAAVPGVAATRYTTNSLTNSGGVYSVNSVNYTIDPTPVPGFDTDNTNFYRLTRDGADESVPAELYVRSATPNTGDTLYSNVGTPSVTEVVGVAAQPANKTVEIETEGGVAPITPGPVNSATLTDLAESNDDDNTTEVHGTVTSRWHPTETGIYIFRRSYVPAVKDNPDTAEDETKAGYYTYAGYYYVADADPDVEGKYYKIVIGDDAFRASNDAEVAADATGTTNFVFDVSADQSVLGDAVDVNEDGSLVGAVRYQFVKDVKVENVTPTLTYHGETNDKPAYLTATYSDESTEEGADAASKQAAYEQAKAEADAARQNYLDKLGDAAASEVDYENALGAYNTALSRYNQAKADWDYAKALSDASKALIDAAAERAAAEKKKDDAEAALKAAYKAVTNEAGELATDGRTNSTAAGDDASKFGDLLTVGLGTENKNDISYVDIFKTNRTYTGLNGQVTAQLEDKINADLDNSQGHAANLDELTKAQEYMGKMKTLWDNSSNGVDATDASIVGAAERLSDAIDALKEASFNYNDSIDTAKYVENAMKEIYAARQKLEDNLKDYKALYQKLALAVGTEPQLTELLSTGDNDGNFGTKIDAWITRIGELETRLEALNNDANIGKKVYTAATIAGGADYGEDARVQDYIIKYNNYVDELANVEDAKADWKTAVETYNKAVSKGQVDYIAAIQTNQQKKDVNNKLAKNDYEGLDVAADNSKWYLTNYNNDLVKLYSVDRDQATATEPITDARDTTKTITATKASDGTAIALINPQITYAEDGWQTIGKDGTSLTTTIDDANYGYYETTTATNTSPAAYTKATNDSTTGVVTEGSYTKAIIAVNTAETAFKTLKANTHSGATANETVDNLYKIAYNTGNDDLLTKKNAAEQAYKDAVKAATDAETASTNAATRAGKALTAAGNAAADDESRIEIIINLAEEASKLDWTSALGNHESAQVADFYYNYILGAGETSSKLIDSVQLSPSVGTSDYKTLVFDLNVALDSAQITYEDDQRTINATAVQSNDAFAKKVVSITPDTLAVQWEPNGTAASADTKYRVGLNVVEPKTYEGGNKSKTINEVNTELAYKFTLNGADYYGKEVKDGATFYKWNATGDTWAADDTAVQIIEIK